MTTHLLHLNDVSTGYNDVPVVRHMNLHVDAGEVVALLGPNGAGKTTTLLAVSGLLPCLTGSILVRGVPVNTKQPHLNARSGIAHVPENRSLFYNLTVRENLLLGLRGSRAARKQALERALDLLPALSRLLNRSAGLLSGGEQQMLALARALEAEPSLLLVDEMSLGLAPIIVESLLPIVRSVAEETGAAVLLVEQHVQMALTVADRAYVLSHGEIILERPAAELAAQPELLRESYLGQRQATPTEEAGSPHQAASDHLSRSPE